MSTIYPSSEPYLYMPMSMAYDTITASYILLASVTVRVLRTTARSFSRLIVLEFPGARLGLDPILKGGV